MTKRAHMTIAPKGGIGKSLIASLLTQWHIDTGQKAAAYDNDPATATLKGYKGLPVRKLEMLSDGVINKQSYDDMFNTMTREDSSFVVDNGASNFVELLNYIEHSGLMEALDEIGIKPTVHVPLVGADDLTLTAAGLQQLVETLSPVAEIVVWQNLYKGDLVGKSGPWEKTELYHSVKDRILAEVRLERRDDMTNAAIKKMLTDRLTFREVDASEAHDFLTKRRLRTVRDDVYRQLTAIFGAGSEAEAA